MLHPLEPSARRDAMSIHDRVDRLIARLHDTPTEPFVQMFRDEWAAQRGDVPLRPETWYAIELQATSAIPEWGGPGNCRAASPWGNWRSLHWWPNARCGSSSSRAGLKHSIWLSSSANGSST